MLALLISGDAEVYQAISCTTIQVLFLFDMWSVLKDQIAGLKGEELLETLAKI